MISWLHRNRSITFRSDVYQRLGLTDAELKVAACIAGQDHVAGIGGYGFHKAVRLLQMIERTDGSPMCDEILKAIRQSVPDRCKSDADVCCSQGTLLLHIYKMASESNAYAAHSNPALTTKTALERFLDEVDERNQLRRPRLSSRVRSHLASIVSNANDQEPLRTTQDDWIRVRKKKRRRWRTERETFAKKSEEKSFFISFNPFSMLGSIPDHRHTVVDQGPSPAANSKTKAKSQKRRRDEEQEEAKKRACETASRKEGRKRNLNEKKKAVNKAKRAFRQCAYSLGSLRKCVNEFLGKPFVEHMQQVVLALSKLVNDANQACNMRLLSSLHSHEEASANKKPVLDLKMLYVEELKNAADEYRDENIHRVLQSTVLVQFARFYQGNIKAIFKTRFWDTLKRHVTHKLTVWGFAAPLALKLSSCVTFKMTRCMMFHGFCTSKEDCVAKLICR